MKCQHCQDVLNKAQFRSNREMKSCPNCSKSNGEYHVYYPYPEAFGTTEKRVTANNPDGPQSYCTDCRGGQEPHSYAPTLCCDI